MLRNPRDYNSQREQLSASQWAYKYIFDKFNKRQLDTHGQNGHMVAHLKRTWGP